MKRTKEEYRAAALLLGMNYDPRTHTFYVMNWEQDLNKDVVAEFDADTMERLSDAQLRERHSQYEIRSVSHDGNAWDGGWLDVTK